MPNNPYEGSGEVPKKSIEFFGETFHEGDRVVLLTNEMHTPVKGEIIEIHHKNIDSGNTSIDESEIVFNLDEKMPRGKDPYRMRVKMSEITSMSPETQFKKE